MGLMAPIAATLSIFVNARTKPTKTTKNRDHRGKGQSPVLDSSTVMIRPEDIMTTSGRARDRQGFREGIPGPLTLITVPAPIFDVASLAGGTRGILDPPNRTPSVR